ncbi:winged helix-turn-helix domain-containing protein [Actinacidiphila sp. ITFR-21]|uniref:winged helix-turn-helix domain-containing protein n=1 Tax=Actinacidiphila sp. ITFR-21 TaxID=3075199 RepID=UPI002889193E|nr:winged helix-turn-helix domain-containing protein [Streptomyces sp. ITFR-21]WNI14998.1 winged helix-turn-helix domain-containing protein [Streptomyces sp. ITFR-21]
MAGSLRFSFSASDVARTRFAVSPLWEVVASVRAYRTAAPRSVHRHWQAEVAPRLAAAGLDRGLLFDLVPPTGCTPDFITPAPRSDGGGFAAELRAVAATPVAQIRRELGAFGLRTGRLEAMYEDPAAGLGRLLAETAAYWEVAIEPYWPKMEAVLSADVFHQARRLAAAGAEAVLGDLHPSVRWTGGTLTFTEKTCFPHIELGGRGLVLVPSIFAWSTVATTAATPFTKQLFYPSRGWGSVWDRDRPLVPEVVAAVLGRTRALLLAELSSPASTSELAGRTGLSAGGVSQHLTALRDAGIVSAHRAGRSVLYMRTPVAESLLAASL